MARILQDDLEKLPSNLIFYKFNKGLDLCSYFPTSEEIKDKLGAYSGIENYSDNIVKTLCYVSKMMKDNPFYNERCHFLYYWLGDILFNNLKDVNSFSTVMDTIYTELNKFNVENKCNIIYTDIGKSFFKQRKIIYDYTQNYETIKQGFRDYGNYCDQEYYEYVEKIVLTYNTVHTNCKNNSDAYCNELKNMFRKYDHEELSKLKCTLVHVPKPVASSSDQDSSFEQATPRGPSLREQPPNDHSLQEKTVSGFFPTLGERPLPSSDEASPRGSNIFMSSAVPVMGVSLAGFVLHKSRRINNGEQMNVGYHSVQYPSHYSGTRS
ncbi:variable surface protein Vir7-like protein [Plasmodium vivax Mauritania I]|uniref:Variable surface protein Vir7-like protein n=1 Tax=Plasmodium vivax Mauritania I TaxID=1035515 RepID=A0A0J9TGK1_PLAVI|nr:variable surface protein Vir7-like protein [Plasmodium vivax Mauritania I]